MVARSRLARTDAGMNGDTRSRRKGIGIRAIPWCRPPVPHSIVVRSITDGGACGHYRRLAHGPCPAAVLAKTPQHSRAVVVSFGARSRPETKAPQRPLQSVCLLFLPARARSIHH